MSPKERESSWAKGVKDFSFFDIGWTQFFECFVVESGSEQYVYHKNIHERNILRIAPIALPIASGVQVDTSNTSDEGCQEVHHSLILITKIQRKIQRYWINMIKLTTKTIM
jgi:hypothetical protein